jgi:hypothetical protein
MNNKILIGSIIAVSLLIGVSFTSVVGYNRLESDVKSSPLFNIRSSRAVDKEGRDFTTDYVGKGEESNLSIPNRDSETVLIQRFADSIRNMDDTTFNRFLSQIISQIQKKSDYEDINEMITFLHQIRNNPQTVILDESKNDNIETIGFEFTPTVCWFPGCLLFLIIGGIIFLPIFLYFFTLISIMFLATVLVLPLCKWTPTIIPWCRP